MTRLAVLLAAIAVLVCAVPEPLRALDEPAERQSIERALAGSIVEGYRARKAELVMEAFRPDAEIITHIAGRIDRGAFGALVAKDLAGFATLQPGIEIQELTFSGEAEALARVLLRISGDRVDGKKVDRGDRLWLLLLKREEGWKIRKQAYRSDFAVGEMHRSSPHGR